MKHEDKKRTDKGRRTENLKNQNNFSPQQMFPQTFNRPLTEMNSDY